MYNTLGIYSSNIKYQGTFWVYFLRSLEGKWLGFLVISMASCHFFISKFCYLPLVITKVLILPEGAVDSEVLEWGGGLWLVKSKELVFLCEKSIIALCVIFISLALPFHKYFPSIFHFRFTSQYIDPFLCSVFLHPAFIILTFVVVFMFSHVLKIFETFSVMVTSSLPWHDIY